MFCCSSFHISRRGTHLYTRRSRERPSFKTGVQISRHQSVFSLHHVPKKVVVKLHDSLFGLMRRYEELLGLTELKAAQRLVLDAERDFAKTQDARREKQDEMRDVQTRLKEIHAELDKTARGEDRYLSLLTQEHSIIKLEKQMMHDFRRLERAERDSFTALSNRLRDSHEKEREQAEKSKYGSLVGSVCCGVLGVLGGLVVNRGRTRDLRVALEELRAEPPRLQLLAERLTSAADQQQRRFAAFVDQLNTLVTGMPALPRGEGEEAPSSVERASGDAPGQLQLVLATLKQQDEQLAREMESVKRLIAVGDSEQHVSTVVYVGPEMRELLDETGRRLERQIKLNSLAQVVLVYTALALALPLLAGLLRGASP